MSRNLDIGNFQRIARVMSDKYDVKVIPEGLRFQTNGRVISFPVNSDYLSDMTKKAIYGLLDHEILHILEEDFHKKENKETPISIIGKLKDKRERIVFGLIEDMRMEIKYSSMYIGIKENISELYDITIPLVFENIRIGKIKDFWNVFSKYIIMKFKGYELDYIDGEYKIFLDLIDDELKKIYEISYGEQSLVLARNIIEKIDDKLDELSDGDDADTDEGEGKGGEGGEGGGDEGEGDGDVSRRVLDMYDKIMEPDSYCDIFDDVKKAIGKEAGIDAKENERYIPNPNVLSKDKWIKPESRDIELYRTNKSEVDSQIRGISSKLINVLKSKAISSIQRGAFSGKLDTRSLHKVNTGKTNVYKNKIIGETLDVAISVVVDLSGSMGNSNEKGTKAYYARLSCVSSAETFNKLSIPFEIIGFYNNYLRKARLVPFTHRVEPLVYVIFKAFNENFNNTKCRLNDITGIGDNTDGEAILEIAKRLYRRRETRKILFVISDGAPLAIHPSPDILEKHLIQVVKTITSTGIEVLSIGMCTDSVALFYNKKTGAKSTSIYNMDEFVVKVYNIVKDSLLSKQLL
jgi:hypothetical protein